MTNDMTTGNPTRLLLAFSVPLLIGNLFQLFYSMADTVIVGRTIGVDALAAVGATGSISFLVIGFVQGVTSGFSVVTAQQFGAGDMQGVRRSVGTGILLSIACTVVLTLISALGAMWLLELMKTPSDIIRQAWEYIVIIFWGLGASMFFNLFSCTLRALGDSRTPLLFLVIACLLNIGLDFLFILRFSMGVAGAAFATIIAQAFSGVLCLVYSLWKFPFLRLKSEDWRLDPAFCWQHLRIALPMAFQFSITAIGAMIVQAALNSLGSAAVAAFTAASRIEQLVTQPLPSFGTAMATFAAQNFGAGKIDRIRVGVRRCCALAIGSGLLAGAILLLFGRQLSQMVLGGEQPEIIEKSHQYLVIMAIFLVVLGLLFVFRNVLQGIGSSTVPLLAGACELIMRAAIAFSLAPALGYFGVCLANPGAWIGATIPLIIAYFAVMRRLDAMS